jgi:anti-anti-sigma factor
MGTTVQLQVELTNQGARAVLRLDGELDLANAAVLESAASSDELASSKEVVLDLDQLTFLDSTGLRVILAVREHCRGRDQLFAVTQGSPQVRRLMSVTGVGEHLKTIPNSVSAIP